ncbi:MAG: hypothetical protein EXR79_14840 [Myxococcales bacterium]|nr:hypothetical protein [Myxococcales bacterium]
MNQHRLPRATVPTRANLLALAGTLALVAMPGCRPEGRLIVAELRNPTDTSYAAQCQRFAAAHETDLKTGTYRPARLQVELWPQPGAATLDETALARALVAGSVKRSLLLARGGLGKSKLAESLRAQVCGQVPIHPVDAAQVAKLHTGSRAIARVVENAARVDVVTQARQAGGRLVILLDGLDEVPRAERAGVLAAVENLAEEIPAVQVVVLARPPVLDDNYGMGGTDARLSIQTLLCADIDAVVAHHIPDAEDRNLFRRFIHRYGLDARDTTATDCAYAYMATYHDINKLLAFYKEATAADSTILVSRAHAHETLATERLHKELESLHWSGTQALALVDRMTRDQLRRAVTRELRFGFGDCEAAASGDRSAVCERMFQSAIFVQVPGGYFAFSAPGLADLFAARWLDGVLAATRPLNCKAAIQHTDLLKDGDVFRFLVAQPNGIACVMPLLDDRCGRDPKRDQIEALEDGLPTGRARPGIVKAMHAGYEGSHWKMCTQKTLKSLDETFVTQ